MQMACLMLIFSCASKSPRIERFLASGQKIGARLPKSGANSDRNRREFRCDCPELRSTAGFVRQSIGTTIDGNGHISAGSAYWRKK